MGLSATAAATDWRVVVGVAAGGALGGLARTLLGLGVGSVLPGWLILAAINVLGSLLLGLVVAHGGRWADRWVTVGVLGGFTTFSGWTLDVVGFLASAPVLSLAVLVAVPVASLGACVAGLSLGGAASRSAPEA